MSTGCRRRWRGCRSRRRPRSRRRRRRRCRTRPAPADDRDLDLERVGHLLDVRRVARAGDTTRCALYDGSRSTRHCGRQSLSQQQTRWVGLVLADQPADEVEQPAHGVDRRAVGGLDLRARRRTRGSTSRRCPAASARFAHARHPATPRAARLAAVTQPDVEATDRQILELLAADGRMSFTDLGKATGLSTSAVHQRVKRLEQRGLIPRLRRHRRPRPDRPAAHGVHLDPPDRPLPARRLPRAAARHRRDRVLLVGGGGGVLHPQGPGRHARRPRGPARPDPRRRQRLHPHHDRAVHAVREPPGDARGVAGSPVHPGIRTFQGVATLADVTERPRTSASRGLASTSRGPAGSAPR